jgi:ABC-type nitrate/sulfonate/bicarbonate transport system substrate-binding protein
MFRHFGLRAAALAAFTLAAAGAALAQDAPVTLRYLASHGSVSAHELAEKLGYFDGLGIKLENVGFSSGGPESLFALASGDLDVGGAATPAVLNAVSSGNDFVAAYPNVGINDTVRSIFYVREDSPIKTAKDIVGATIAVNTLGAHLDYAIRETLRQLDLPPDAVNLVVVPGPQLEQTLRSGQVDIAAFGYWQTTFEGVARNNGGLRPVFEDIDFLGEIAGGFAVLRRDFVEAHPKAARDFAEQSSRAADWFRENPEKGREILAEILNERGENPDLAQYFAGYGLRIGGQAAPRDIQFWIDVLVRDGAIAEGAVTPEKILLANVLETLGQ